MKLRSTLTKSTIQESKTVHAPKWKWASNEEGTETKTIIDPNNRIWATERKSIRLKDPSMNKNDLPFRDPLKMIWKNIGM